jgi:formylglycine-generating enzyme required for sulfatase activity
MAGSVWEWTRSLWGKGFANPDFRYPYNLNDWREQLDASDKFMRVLRGGGDWANRRVARCACRGWYPPDGRAGYLGFRIVVRP